jgi:Protein of unknown function (DUF3301)
MELGWAGLILLTAAGAVAWFWHDSLAARESANAAAIEACKRLGLQFLDGTVAFARLSFAREAGWLTLRRTYVFDYTANSIERRQGFVLLTGRRVESVGYAPGDTHPDAAREPAPPQFGPGKVLDSSERLTLGRDGKDPSRPAPDDSDRRG